jgi:apolipoprotein D and lipocalin family protein
VADDRGGASPTLEASDLSAPFTLAGGLMKIAIMLALTALFVGCSSARSPELATVEYVDLERFMGRWYVLASIPTFLEKDAYNAVETYELDDDGTIATTFEFRKGGFDGEEKRFNPRGFIRDPATNALWGMRFVWPIKADYRIIHLDDAYSTTIIGRQKRDFVWIMARTPTIDETTWASLEQVVVDAGYDLAELQRVPQQW